MVSGLAIVVAACGGDDDAASTTESTVAVETTIAATTGTSIETTMAATTTEAPATTDASTTTDPPTTTTPETTAAPTTAAPAAARPIVAVTAAGDGVYLPTPDAAPVLLYDGVDPDTPPPEEGPGPNVIDGIAVTSDGSRAFIGLCCEPVVGSILETVPPAPAVGPSIMFGSAPALDPSGTVLAVGLLNADGAVRDVATGEVTPGLELDGANFSPLDVVWLDESTFLVLGLWQDDLADEWRIIETTLGATSLGQVISVVPSGETIYRFAGLIDDDTVAVHEFGSAEVLTVDVSSGEIDTQALVGNSLTYWFGADGADVRVDDTGVLTVGDTVVPGEYLWAR